MNLTEKLLAIPLRENAGSRTGNRFNYQQVWAFNHMLELIRRETDFLLLMELHDDVNCIRCGKQSKVCRFLSN